MPKELKIIKMPELKYFPNLVLGLLNSDETKFWKQSFGGFSEKEQQAPVLVDIWKNGSFEFGRNFFSEEWKNMKGRVLKMATFNYPPYSIIGELYNLCISTLHIYASNFELQMEIVWMALKCNLHWSWLQN